MIHTKLRSYCIGLLLMALATSAMAQEKNFPRQYKREHQNALSDILQGRVEKAIKGLQGLAKRLPDDAETQFMLAVAYHTQGDDQSALNHAQQALDLGLPPGRILGGSHNHLVGIPNLAEKLKLTDQLKLPVHGPMLGQVSGQGVSIWLRTAGPQKVRAFASLNKDLAERVNSAEVMTSVEHDFTAVLQIDGLKPNTAYHYGIEIDGQLTHRPNYTFRTFAKQGEPVKFRYAFGGGSGYVPPNERAWDTILAEKPDVLVLLGDNVYIDDPTTPDMQHYCYYRRQSRPEFRRLVAQTPTYTIWDDHDFATNDSQGGPAIEQPAFKRPVFNVYRDNWVNPAYGGGDQQPGVWYDYYLGDVHFIMLDGRYYRDRKPADGSTPTMLGPVQKAWLKKTLKASQGKLIMLASPVPWVFEAKGDSPDTWNGFKQERAEIFDYLSENKIEGVVLVSADRHRSDLWKIERPGSYSFYEMNSSRLTNQHVHPTMKQAIFSYNKKQSFGTVDVDTTAADPTVTYRVVTIDGEEVFSHTIKRSELVK